MKDIYNTTAFLENGALHCIIEIPWATIKNPLL